MTYIVNRFVIVLGSFVGSKWTFLLLNKSMFDSLFISPEGQRAVNMKSEQTSINPEQVGFLPALGSHLFVVRQGSPSLPPPTLMSIVKSSVKSAVKSNMKSTMQSTVKSAVKYTLNATVKSFGLIYLNTFREGLLTNYVCFTSEILTKEILQKKNSEKIGMPFFFN